MKKIKTILAILPALLFSCAGDDVEKYIPPTPIAPSEPGEEVVYHKRAKEQFDLINQCYRINSGATEGLYNENYPKKDGDNSASFLWPYDGLVSGAAALHALGYDVNYADMVDRFEVYYRTPNGTVGGYGSQTNGTTGSGTRFYDDNSIVGIELVEAFNLLNNQDYVTKAKRIVEFLQAGEDDTFGGGLWWNEDQKGQQGVGDSNKPTCANGYATLFLLEYYSVCPQEEKADVLALAKRLYAWTLTNLRDPEDGCYWNDKQADGSINKTKWTYNTGVMISNGVRLYKIFDCVYLAGGHGAMYDFPDDTVLQAIIEKHYESDKANGCCRCWYASCGRTGRSSGACTNATTRPSGRWRAWRRARAG